MNIMSSFFKQLLPYCLILLSFNTVFVTSALAQEISEAVIPEKPLKFYDVELILFKNIKVPKGIEKILPTQAPLLDEQHISFNTQEGIDAAAERQFMLLEDNEFRLLNALKRIKRSSRYKLLSHMAWRQPGLASKDALAIQIRTGERFGNEYSSIDNPVIPFKEINKEDELKKLSLINNNPPQETDIEKVWYELEGKITITLARYLHAYVDLVLRIPNQNTIQFNSNLETANQIDQEEQSFSSETLNNFAFKEHRRMRSRKLHYLDNPEMGMLILITPYEAPEPVEFIDEALEPTT